MMIIILFFFIVAVVCIRGVMLMCVSFVVLSVHAVLEDLLWFGDS